jgi:hypothetical protein
MKKSRLESLAIFAAVAFAWQRLGLKDLLPAAKPTPSCPVGEAPRWFFGTQIINGRSVGPGWVCLPVDITKL